MAEVQSTIIKLTDRMTYINTDFIGWMEPHDDQKLKYHFTDGTELTIHYETTQKMYDDIRKFINSKLIEVPIP